MSTDAAWEEWGRRDPYFAVITDPKYRRSRITEELKREFFASGAIHVRYIFDTIRRQIDPAFNPRTVLDFGCGVGRLLVPFAEVAEEVVGLDVSTSMLSEAKRNCGERQVHNVRLIASTDDMSALTGAFDLIHSYIVFQHIPVQRGREIFGKLLEYLRPGGVCAIHLTYATTNLASSHGIAQSAVRSPGPHVTSLSIDADPEMQMNPYNMNEILFSLQRLGFTRTYIDFTDHGGEVGVFLFSSIGESTTRATPI